MTFHWALDDETSCFEARDQQIFSFVACLDDSQREAAQLWD